MTQPNPHDHLFRPETNLVHWLMHWCTAHPTEAAEYHTSQEVYAVLSHLVAEQTSRGGPGPDVWKIRSVAHLAQMLRRNADLLTGSGITLRQRRYGSTVVHSFRLDQRETSYWEASDEPD